MGGPNRDQLIEYVRSFDPRSWSCLHVTEGDGLRCTNATVQHNEIGPCGSDAWQEWADGISLSCRDATVHNNTIVGPTDGGVVVFGSPGSVVENNTIVLGNVSGKVSWCAPSSWLTRGWIAHAIRRNQYG